MGKVYRGLGSTNFAASYDVALNKPFDTRSVVSSVSDLTTKSTWYSYDASGKQIGTSDNVYTYPGMLVVVSSTGEIYTLIGSITDYQYMYGVNGKTVGWKRVDAGSAASDISSLSTKVNNVISDATNLKGSANSLFGINGSVIQSKYLPSYVDDLVKVTVTTSNGKYVLKYNDNTDIYGTNVIVGSSSDTNRSSVNNKIFIDDDNNQYRATLAGSSSATIVKISSASDSARIDKLENTLTWKTLIPNVSVIKISNSQGITYIDTNYCVNPNNTNCTDLNSLLGSYLNSCESKALESKLTFDNPSSMSYQHLYMFKLNNTEYIILAISSSGIILGILNPVGQGSSARSTLESIDGTATYQNISSNCIFTQEEEDVRGNLENLVKYDA